MSEEKPLLVLDPKAELHFKGPFTEVVTSHLKLSNPSDRRICFKVKTTAPKRYCVRPNNGIVEPKSSALIAVMLQPFDIESQTDRNKHKFMVQTIFVPDGDVNQDALWREASPDAIHDSKLKCVFDVVPRPGGGTGSNNVSSSDPVPATVIQQQASLNASSFSSSGTTPVNNISNIERSPVPVARPVSGSGSKDETRSLVEEISRLRNENMHLKEEGLRQRIRSGESSTADLLKARNSSLSNTNGLAGQEVLQLLMNPNVLAIGLVLFAIGIVLGKVLF